MAQAQRTRQRTTVQPASDPFLGDVSDGELVTRAVEGDRWAKEALFRRHVAPLTKLITRLMARHRDAEDVVQDAFAKAWRDLDRLRDPEAFGVWLRRIAVNRFKNVHRRRKVAQALGLDSGVDDASLYALASHDASPEALAELRQVDAALRRIPAEQRVVWILRHVQGENLATIAQIADCSLATVKRRLESADVSLAHHLRHPR